MGEKCICGHDVFEKKVFVAISSFGGHNFRSSIEFEHLYERVEIHYFCTKCGEEFFKVG